MLQPRMRNAWQISCKRTPSKAANHVSLILAMAGSTAMVIRPPGDLVSAVLFLWGRVASQQKSSVKRLRKKMSLKAAISCNMMCWAGRVKGDQDHSSCEDNARTFAKEMICLGVQRQSSRENVSIVKDTSSRGWWLRGVSTYAES